MCQAAIAKPLLAAGLSHDMKTMTIDETNLLHKKAETKKDGVYSFRGNLWGVKSGKFVAFVNPRGQVLQRFGSFNTQIGDLSSVERWDWKKKLVEWLRSQ
jgi:hypothetical protein